MTQRRPDYDLQDRNGKSEPAEPRRKAQRSLLLHLRSAIGRQLLHPEQLTGLPIAMTPAAFFLPKRRIWRRRYAERRCDGDCRSGAVCIGECASGQCDNSRSRRFATRLGLCGYPIPSNDQAVELAERSMRIFMASVREKSMQGLWTHSSARFREKFSVAQLDKVFKGFYDLKITGDPLAGKSPIFTAGPMINGTTIWSSRLLRDHTLARQLPSHLHDGRSQLELVGINVSAKPPPAPDLSSPPETSGEPPFQSL